MDLGDIAASWGQPVTFGSIVLFTLATLRWLLSRGDDLQREAIEELRRQRDEYRAQRDEELSKRRKAEKLVRGYYRRHGPLPEAAVTGSVSIADLMAHIREHDDEGD